jgi:hypothetical protein
MYVGEQQIDAIYAHQIVDLHQLPRIDVLSIEPDFVAQDAEELVVDHLDLSR